MKISVSTLPFYPIPLKNIFNSLLDINVNYCEIINEYPYDSIENDLIDSYDLKISIHAPLSDINLASHNEVIRKISISEIKKSIDMAIKIDSKVIVVHPGHVPILGRRFKDKILQYNRDSLMECSKYAQEMGIKMCVENMPNIEGLLFKDLNKLENLVLDIDAYITLDVGHAHNNKFTVEDMLKTSRIEHIHLSDNDRSFDNHNALGDIKKNGLNFKSLFKGLKQINYNNLMVLEVEQPNDVVNSLQFIKKISE
ncbi:MAG: sugar phosphate isomerase/epimerase family protein [Methanobacterium sp.]